jgi:phospholipid/cholesterol/gamma-HCH transport system substrate-binding protein
MAVAALVAAALAILAYGRSDSLHGKTVRVYVATDAARGVIRGTEVWLDGRKVGLVKGVSFRPPSVSSRERLVLAIDVLDEARDRVRLDSKVQLRAGSSIIGDQVVYMKSGTAGTRRVRDGDTLVAGRQNDLQGLSSDWAMASHEFPAIVKNVKVLTAQLRTTEGTISALGIDMQDGEMAGVGNKTSVLLHRLSNSQGTLGLAMSNADDLRDHATRVTAQVDSIRTLLASGEHSLGRFRRDSTLTGVVGRVREEARDLQRRVDSPDGSIGRFARDSAITMGIHRDVAALDSLFADMKKHPLRYVAF